MSFCAHCGTPMQVRYRPVGFDTFWGTRQYAKEERCPHARGWGWLRHTVRVDRWIDRAEWFGFTDATIPNDWLALRFEQEAE